LLEQIFGYFSYTLFVVAFFIQFKLVYINVLFKNKNYNNTKPYRKVGIKDLQEALKIVENSEDKLFLINSIKWHKIYSILFYTSILTAILTLIITVNKWDL